jgi:hypothetical protein
MAQLNETIESQHFEREGHESILLAPTIGYPKMLLWYSMDMSHAQLLVAVFSSDKWELPRLSLQDVILP